jgi:hypothetical protein
MTNLLLCSSCQYQFTNRKLKPPLGYNSIHAAPLYDISGGVWPIHILNESIQAAIISKNKIMLTSARKADIYLETTLIDVKSQPINAYFDPRNKLAPTDYIATTKNPTAPADLVQLNQATEYGTDQSLTLHVKFNAFDLLSKASLFKKEYKLSGSYRQHFGRTPPEHFHLWSEEAKETVFRQLSEQIAADFVTSFLRR